MIIITIIVALIIVWNLLCFGIVLEADEGIIFYGDESLYLKIAKLYWWSVITIMSFFILILVSSAIARPIWCSISNNDDKICEKVNGVS